MPITGGKQKQAPGKKGGGGRMPSKRSINLAAVNEKPGGWLITFLFVGAVLVGAVILIRTTVADRMHTLSEVRQEIALLEAQLQEGSVRVEDYDRLSEVYAHYTWSGLTAEEAARPDYAAAMDLLYRVILSRMTLDSWTLSGNELTLSINGGTLDEINQIAEELNADEVVNYCSVTAAALSSVTTSSERPLDQEMVTANMVIYLKSANRG